MPYGPGAWFRFGDGMSCSCMPFLTGPARREFDTRPTYCARTNKVLDMLHDIASLKHYAILLHGKRPRPIRSDVTFASTHNSAEGCRMDGSHTAIGCSLPVQGCFRSSPVYYRLDLAQLCSHAFRRPIPVLTWATILFPSSACCLPPAQHAMCWTHLSLAH